MLKDGKSIVLLIRPTDNFKIIFHNLLEKETLMREDSELWGSSAALDTQKITLGDVLLWNKID